ncbi:hypothetical protein B0H17DRAFT_1329273 [Mycena rosella]|uniref:Uncharacterized protein n=1 Tax=Mycena rosella TaxID=1033263 RepID=A0AAD7DQV9_MYCRO|nr:hypothetical protein B0H17DRAFT_1329273 [Mycena rosella]
MVPRNFHALSVPIPRREDTVFPLADEDDDYSYDDEQEEYPHYTLNLGAGSECASLCPSACPTPPLRPSLKNVRLAPPLPAPAVPRSWEWQADEIAPILAEPAQPPSPVSDSSRSSESHSSPASESEEEDLTDYSFPALQHARLLQSRRHAPHPLSAVLGLRGGVLSAVRVLACVVAVAVLAGSGRWSGEASL